MQRRVDVRRFRRLGLLDRQLQQHDRVVLVDRVGRHVLAGGRLVGGPEALEVLARRRIGTNREGDRAAVRSRASGGDVGRVVLATAAHEGEFLVEAEVLPLLDQRARLGVVAREVERVGVGAGDARQR